MMSTEDQNSIYDIKISTVSAGSMSGHNAIQELTAMDLAMKLHYLRFLYYFKYPAFDGLTILKIKETMFDWLNYAYIPIGRLRRAESGRPFIKCNDSGVRVIEATIHISLDEWLESVDDSRHKLLVPNQVLGPDLAFSPLVSIQLTDFRCGGKSVGISWSHVLGDALSAVGFINLWAQVMAGYYPAQPLTMAQQQNHTFEFDNPSPDLLSTKRVSPKNPNPLLTKWFGPKNPNPSPDPLSVKRVGPVGDIWCTLKLNHSKMEPCSFYISSSDLTQLQAKICVEKADEQIPVFECICVVIWQSLAKIRNMVEPKVVTICRSDLRNRHKGIFTNESQTISVVKTDISVGKYTPMELGSLLMNKVDDERMKIEEAMGSDGVLPDFLIYGANLTFVDLSDASFYEMEVRGHKPVYVNCFIDNIGDEGVVLVLPTPEGCSDGRIITVTLPENMVLELKSVLKQDWCIA